MTTQVGASRRPKTAPEPTPAVDLTEEMLRNYLPDEVVELKLLRCSVRWLKDEAYARRIPHTTVAGRVAFRMEHILRISQMFDVEPILIGRRAA